MPPRRVDPLLIPSSTPRSPRGLSDSKQKIGFTLRPSPTPSSPTAVTAHKTFLRMHMHRAALDNMGLKIGDLISVRSMVTSSEADTEENDGSSVEYLPAIAWLATDPHITGKIALVADGWREMLGVEYGSKVLIERYLGDEPLEAAHVVVKEVNKDGTVPDPRQGWRKEGEGWKYFLEDALLETKYVFQDMPFISLEYKGIRRTFSIEEVVPVSTIPATPPKTHSKLNCSMIPAGAFVKPAYKVLPTTKVTIMSHPGASEVVIPVSTSNSPNAHQHGLRTPSASPPPALTPGPERPPVTLPSFAQIGGLSAQLAKLKTLLLTTLVHCHQITPTGLTPFRGILLHGPPGAGKSLIMRTIPASLPQLWKPISTYKIDGSIVGKYLGESEATIRRIFAEAKSNQPSIIFIDEIDTLAPRRTVSGEASDGRVVATLLTQMDELGDGATVVVAATNRPDHIDEGLRRPGRLDMEIEIPRPDVGAREEILRVILKKVRKGWLEEGSEDANGQADEIIRGWASRTHGFVGADIEALVRVGFVNALSRFHPTPPSPDGTVCPSVIPTPEYQPITLQVSDIELALKEVRPTAMRELYMEIPNVRWSDIGGQDELKQHLREAVELPLIHPEVFTRLGGTPRKGILLYGPPGCSKTLAARALATEAGLNFIAVKGPELLNMYVGESERAVREVFRKAKAASPSIIFFDEVDALGGSRSHMKGGNGVNVLTALLTEMDGLEALRGVIILAATNKPDLIDPALLRPGRLDTLLYVGPPDLPGRREILAIKTKRMALAQDVDLEGLAQTMEGYSGAEIINICDEAVYHALREDPDITSIANRHFESAMAKGARQITGDMIRYYEDWRLHRI